MGNQKVTHNGNPTWEKKKSQKVDSVWASEQKAYLVDSVAGIDPSATSCSLFAGPTENPACQPKSSSPKIQANSH